MPKRFTIIHLCSAHGLPGMQRQKNMVTNDMSIIKDTEFYQWCIDSGFYPENLINNISEDLLAGDLMIWDAAIKSTIEKIPEYKTMPIGFIGERERAMIEGYNQAIDVIRSALSVKNAN